MDSITKDRDGYPSRTSFFFSHLQWDAMMTDPGILDVCPHRNSVFCDQWITISICTVFKIHLFKHALLYYTSINFPPAFPFTFSIMSEVTNISSWHIFSPLSTLRHISILMKKSLSPNISYLSILWSSSEDHFWNYNLASHAEQAGKVKLISITKVLQNEPALCKRLSSQVPVLLISIAQLK